MFSSMYDNNICKSVCPSIYHEKAGRVPHRMKRYSICIMRLSKAVTTTAVIMGFIVFVFYYNTFNLMNFYAIDKPLNDMITATIRFENDTDFIIATKGCTIPNYSKTLKFIEAKYENKTCGHRAIFLNKIGHDKIRFIIQSHPMKQYAKGKPFICCYKFASRSKESGNEDAAITYKKIIVLLLHGHNRSIHQELVLKYDLMERRLPYYKYLRETVLRAKLCWDQPIITNRTILANKPDILLMDRELSLGGLFLGDTTIPFDENLVKDETEKKRKSLDLAYEMTDMWGRMSTEIIPIIVSANGLILVSLSQHLRRLGLRDGSLLAQMQKTVILDTARIVSRFLTLSPLYTTCRPFKNETVVELEQEVVTVSCSVHPGKSKKVIYEDAYIIVKKINVPRDESTRNMPWNVLLVGMDTMSRARVYDTMPHTAQYLQKRNWLDFRGYQKVGFNTFPNLMAFLTGKKMSTVYKSCSKGMSNCNDLLMWSKFKDAGYVTAYGEDYLKLPDTFSRYKGFSKPPTTHYARPFFLTGEEKAGNFICIQKKPSGVHLLDYAADFAQTYENDKFFGMFWMNSFSHNANNMPALVDGDVVDFFEKLEATNILNNTFIVFLSDHGIRYGEMRVPVESYYEERLPMFFMWVPHRFQEQYYEEYNNLKINQYRLSTPYDFHLTMWNILKVSNSLVETVPSEACPLCDSLFYEKTSNRTCTDAGVSEKWCSCHEMIKVKENDEHLKPTVQLSVSYIQNITKKIETIECTECEKLTLESVLRHHYYVAGEKKYYIVAFVMAPGSVAFETNIEEANDEIKILEPTETISAYNTRGNCVQNPNDRSYCVCKKLKKCNKKRKK